MGRRFLFILALVVLLGGWQKSTSLPDAAEIESTLKELAAITGFRIRHQLPFQLISREQVNQFLNEKIKKTVKPEEIRAEETTLKKFGFVPNDFDLKKTTIDLLTEQAAAFYDYDRKKLFISDWATKNMRDAAIIHELAHALADQNYPIAKYLRGGQKSSEQSSAREAVVEGQASWLMLEVAARRAGTSLRDPEISKQYLRDQSDEGGSEFPVFDKAPLYLQRTLIFPYDDGMKFQQAVFLHDGNDAFARLFRQPPIATTQIIHPQRYFEQVPFSTPVLPKPAKGAKGLTEGSLGELETAVLLEQFGDKGTSAWLSAKLKGSSYRIDEVKAGKRTTLIYISEWADDDAAKAYFGQYAKALAKKWKSFETSLNTEDRIAGKSEDGYFEVTRKGPLVSSREGFDQPIE